tara:strand:- start:266 stop:874 length:609 start_codon:yes stop_codon:yes gene_type:complete
MAQKNQVLKLFSQPLFKYQIENYEELNKNLLKFIYELKKNDTAGVKKSNINGWHSKPFNLDDENELPKKFLNQINVNIKDVFHQYGWVFDIDKVKCTSMWAIINKKGNFNIEHTHPNNHLSAAYYVKAPNNCGNFKASNPNILNRNIQPKSSKGTEFNSNSISVKINEGDLLIFPAYLPHSVEENESDEDRVIVSFNLDIIR